MPIQGGYMLVPTDSLWNPNRKQKQTRKGIENNIDFSGLPASFTESNFLQSVVTLKVEHGNFYYAYLY